MSKSPLKKTDELFSRYIRARDKVCQRCGTPNNLQCSHVIPRTVKGLRFDEDNAIGLCVGCHIFWWHKEPLAAAEWFEEQFPGRYAQLKEAAAARLGQKLDYPLITASLKERLKELELAEMDEFFLPGT